MVSRCPCLEPDGEGVLIDSSMPVKMKCQSSCWGCPSSGVLTGARNVRSRVIADEDESDLVREAVIKSLSLLPSPARTSLLEALSHPSALARQAACQAWERWGMMPRMPRTNFSHCCPWSLIKQFWVLLWNAFGIDAPLMKSAGGHAYFTTGGRSSTSCFNVLLGFLLLSSPSLVASIGACRPGIA